MSRRSDDAAAIRWGNARLEELGQELDSLRVTLVAKEAIITEQAETLALHENQLNDYRISTPLLLEQLDKKRTEIRELRISLTALAGMYTEARQSAVRSIRSFVPVLQVGDEMAKRAWKAQAQRWADAKAGIV